MTNLFTSEMQAALEEDGLKLRQLTGQDHGPEFIVETPSPFLPGTNIQYAWDSTSLGLLKTCPRLYQYVMIEGWTTTEENVHLRFGIEYHQALHDYANSRSANIPYDDAVHDTVRLLLERTFDFDFDHKVKTRANLVRTVIWYLEHFKNDVAETVQMDDGRPAVEVSFKFELDWGPQIQHTLRTKYYEDYIAGAQTTKYLEERVNKTGWPTTPYLLCGHLDRIVNYNGDLYVMDRKTTTITPSSYFFDQFEPNNQMSLYTLASQVVMKSPIRGVIIDAAQVAVGFSRFTRGMTHRTKDQTEEWLHDLRYWFALAESYANANYFPMNDTSCDKFGGCKFRPICSKSPNVREKFLAGKYKKLPSEERWNPLAVRG